jgi:hypothetical protein
MTTILEIEEKLQSASPAFARVLQLQKKKLEGTYSHLHKYIEYLKSSYEFSSIQGELNAKSPYTGTWTPIDDRMKHYFLKTLQWHFGEQIKYTDLLQVIKSIK